MIQPADDGTHTTMESAVAEIMEKYKTGNEEQHEIKLKKLISAILLNKGSTLGQNKASTCSDRRMTISEIGNRYQAYKERKASLVIEEHRNKVGLNVKHYNMCKYVRKFHGKDNNKLYTLFP